MKSAIKIIISLAIGFFLLFYCIKFVNLEKILINLSNVNYYLLIPAMFFYLLAYFIRSLKLYTLRPEEANNPNKPLTVFKNFTYVLAGNMVNYLIPLRAGEVVKAYFYKKNHGIRWSSAFPALTVDKIFDMFAIFLVLVLIIITDVHFRKEIHYLVGILIFVIMLSILVLTFATFKEKLVIDLLNKFFFFIPHRFKEKVSNFIRNFVAGISVCARKKSNFIPCSLFTLLAVIFDSLYFYMLFLAFHVENSTYIYALLGYTLLNLSYILPQPPAQIGSSEVITGSIFIKGFGLDINQMSSLWIVSRTLTMIVILFTGYLSLFSGGFRIKDFIKDKESKENG